MDGLSKAIRLFGLINLVLPSKASKPIKSVELGEPIDLVSSDELANLVDSGEPSESAVKSCQSGWSSRVGQDEQSIKLIELSWIGGLVVYQTRLCQTIQSQQVALFGLECR